MKRIGFMAVSFAAAVVVGAHSAQAQEVVLKIHHFLPPQATIQTQFFTPWCEKLGKESGGRIKCQIYPAMQLGGTPPQLFDQARDGVADIVWSLPTYQAGRFVKSEVFELPFMAKSAESASARKTRSGQARSRILGARMQRRAKLESPEATRRPSGS